VQECQNGVRRIHGFLTETTRELDRYLKSTQGINQDENQITYDIYPKIMEFFRNKMQRLKPGSTEIQRPKAGSTEIEKLEYLETYIIKELDRAVASAENRDIHAFLASINLQVERMLQNMRSTLDTLTSKCIPDEADTRIVEDLPVQLRTIEPIKQSDLRILAEVWVHSQKTKKRCVIITLDMNDFLKHAKAIEQATGIVCCDPLYASYYARASL